MSGLPGTISVEMIVEAVAASGLQPLPESAARRFATYYALLQRWNARTNLTSIRSAEDVLQRHFIECIFCAQKLPEGITTLLDYGSGAGFPGIPIALCRPEIRVTLGEAQGKKASFLREAVRTLQIDIEVFGDRVESMDQGRFFEVVTLRAVDKMQAAVEAAVDRVDATGLLAVLAATNPPRFPPQFMVSEFIVPGLRAGKLLLGRRRDVPRGT